MQPYLFPYIGYFQLIKCVDIFILLDDVTFINRGWINRNFIIVNKKKYMFTFSLKNKSQNTLIKDLELFDKKKNSKKFLKTLSINYSKTKSFSIIYPLIKDILFNNEIKLSRLVKISIERINPILTINTPIIFSSSISNSKNLNGEDRIIDICKKMNANNYINLSGGIDLYDKEKFETNKLKLNFIKPKDFVYNQNGENFLDKLSIIDVMMNNDLDNLAKLIKEYSIYSN